MSRKGILNKYANPDLIENITEEECDAILADEAYSEHLNSENDAANISELWKELDI